MTKAYKVSIAICFLMWALLAHGHVNIPESLRAILRAVQREEGVKGSDYSSGHPRIGNLNRIELPSPDVLHDKEAALQAHLFHCSLHDWLALRSSFLQPDEPFWRPNSTNEMKELQIVRDSSKTGGSKMEQTVEYVTHLTRQGV